MNRRGSLNQMKWFLKINYIIIYFHILIVIGLLVIADYALFSLIIEIYNIYFVLLLLALFSGIGILISMNTCIHLIENIKKKLYLGSTQHKQFIQFLIALLAGSFIAIPGIIISIIGWILYLKPIRMLITNILYKHKIHIFMRLYSYFVSEYIEG